MNKQITLSAITDELGQAKTRKKEFLQQIERIIPWGEWMEIMGLC
jgi:IS5 family transposase